MADADWDEVLRDIEELEVDAAVADDQDERDQERIRRARQLRPDDARIVESGSAEETAETLAYLDTLK